MHAIGNKSILFILLINRLSESRLHNSSDKVILFDFYWWGTPECGIPMYKVLSSSDTLQPQLFFSSLLSPFQNSGAFAIIYNNAGAFSTVLVTRSVMFCMGWVFSGNFFYCYGMYGVRSFIL